ncbi:hypothetical protein AB0950_16460 [Streptomyces sp. NPDC007189]|uniref:hypothetical protein n=1 Tax=unclassified Streptomyces TaxID=2593676 RepID=UPI0033E581BF
MTPWLRTSLRCVRLLPLVLAVSPPTYGTVTAHTMPAYAAHPGPRTSPDPPHRPAPHDAAQARPAHPERTAHGKHAGRGDRGDPEPSDGGAGSASPGPDHFGFPVPGRPPIPPMPSDSASASYRPTAVEPTRAGSRPGEGRMRPGRPDGPASEVEGDDPIPTAALSSGQAEEPETADLPTATPTPSNTPDAAGLDRPPPQNAAPQGETDQPVLQILPLGSGLVLIGLGLALALLGLRLRRD